MTGLDFVTLKAMKKAKLTVSRVCVCVAASVITMKYQTLPTFH